MKTARLLALALFLFILAPLATSAALAQDEPAKDEKAPKTAPETVVTLLEPGQEPRIALRARPEKGMTQESEMIMRMSMQQSMNGMGMPPTRLPAMRMVMKTVVDDVKEDGDIAFSSTTTRTEVRDEPGVNPMVRQQVEQMVRSMEGMVVRAVVSNRGIVRSTETELPAGLDPLTRQQMEGVMGSAEQFASPLPEEPVGVGAKWQVKTTITQQGMTIEQTTTYTLKSLDDDAMDLGVEIKQTAQEQNVEAPGMPPGASMRLMSLESEGSGETRLRLAAIMPERAQTKMSSNSDIALEMGGQSQTMNQKMEMEMRLRDVKPERDEETNDKPAESGD